MRAEEAAPTLRQTQEQFGRQARRYAESALHRRGPTLETILRLAGVQAQERALDVGTGAGFTAFALAAAAGPLIAIDPTGEMLAEARRLAGERGLSGRIEWTKATAEALPLTPACLDVITCRFASHHFQDLRLALGEFARALRPGGRAIICDVVAPEPAAMVELMNRLEKVRDPTHVWNYTLSQWRRELLPGAGLRAREVVQGKNPQLFSEWVHRAGTPGAAVQELLQMFSSASKEARRAFDIRWQGAEIYFSWDNAVILTTKQRERLGHWSDSAPSAHKPSRS